MLARIVLVAVVVCGGCAPKHGVTTMVPLAKPAQFAGQVKRFRVRVTEPAVIIERGPYYGGQPDHGETSHHANVPELVQSILVAKGYEVTFVWDNPWTYGPMRPCLMVKYVLEPGTLKILSATPDPQAGPCTRTSANSGERVTGYQMSRYDGPPLAADEAFLEVATSSIVDVTTTSSVVETETKVGRVTDANGETLANVYETGHETREHEQVDRKALASIQVFVGGTSGPVLDSLVWNDETQHVLGLVKSALEQIPPRAH